jgi:hypothetical protein
VLFFGGYLLCDWFFGNPVWGILSGFVTMPLFLAIMVGLQVRSGVALDSWWRPTYLRGSWQYRASLIWHTTAIILIWAVFIVLASGGHLPRP